MQAPEFELTDAGVFDDDRYFDVFAEYGKNSPNDILIRITIWNRGPEPARLHLLPTLWFRNTWSWGPIFDEFTAKPSLTLIRDGLVEAEHGELGEYQFAYRKAGEPLFTENETNAMRLFGVQNSSPYVKDAFHEYIVHGRKDAVNPNRTGTKFSPLLCLGSGRRWFGRRSACDSRPKQRLQPNHLLVLTKSSTNENKKLMSFTPRISLPEFRRRRGQSPAKGTPACYGANNFTITWCGIGCRRLDTTAA